MKIKDGPSTSSGTCKIKVAEPVEAPAQIEYKTDE